jgi:hypothetical protein
MPNDTHIYEKAEFLGAEDIVLAVGKNDAESMENFYAIGVINHIASQETRPIGQQGEIGSGKTFTILNSSNKSMSINRLMIKGKSLLYALYYPTYGNTSDGDFKPLSEVNDGIIGGDPGNVEAEYGSNDILGGDDVVLSVPDDPTTDPTTENGVITDLNPIGLIQGITIGSQMPVNQIPEIGSTAKYVMAQKAVKSITFNRIITNYQNVLAALYGEVDKLHFDLDLAKFKAPVFPVLTYYGKEDGAVHSQTMLSRAIVSSIGHSSQSGNKGIAESLEMTWADTIYMSGSPLVPDAPGTLKFSNIWIDLDHLGFRLPFNMMLSYYGVNSEGNAKELKKQILLENVLVASIGRAFGAGSYQTVEDSIFVWEKSTDMDLR